MASQMLKVMPTLKPINDTKNDFLTSNLSHKSDISYKNYISNDQNLQFLCSPHTINLKYIDNAFTNHDYECEFLLLRYITETKAHRDLFPKETPGLLKLNRQPLALPYQYNAVPINKEIKSMDINLNNYINASYIAAPFNKTFIAAENPKPETINNFWRVILNYKISLIVCLSYTFSESNVTFVKYWPDDDKKPFEFTDGSNVYHVHLKVELSTYQAGLAKNMDYGNCIRRTFDITPKNNPKNVLLTITQTNLDCWDDKSLPVQTMGFDLIEDLIGVIDDEFKTKNTPVLVHCSDGIGRTGTLIALYNIIKCLSVEKKNEVKEPVYNVFNVVRKLREERYGMVSESIQYKYIYEFCWKWMKKFYDV